MTTGQLIKYHREQAGLSVPTAAAKAAVGLRSWYEYEKDEASPTVRMLEKIAPALDVAPRDLVGKEMAGSVQG